MSLATAAELAIDWRRLSRPQPDAYDTDILLELGGDPAPRTARVEGPSLCGGRVALSNDDPLMPMPPYLPVGGVPETLERAIFYVARWPAMALQWPRIVRTVQCFTDPFGGGPLRSSSHSVDSRPGTVALTVDCPLATAQALVHETAHLKLRMMGVRNESADRIVANPPDELHESPIVTEMLRPMTAVLHAQYSFMHVLQLDLEMLAKEDDPAVRRDIGKLLARNAPRMARGLATLRRELRTDEEGAAFCEGFFDWCETALERSRQILAGSAEAASG